MKRLMILFMALSGVLAVSCEKPLNDTKQESGDKFHTVTIGFNHPVELQTRSGESYDKVDRLDVYYYEFGYEEKLLGHETFHGDEALDQTLCITMEENEYMYFLFMANLPEDLALYLEQLSRADIVTKANFAFEKLERLDYQIMGSTASVKFDSDKNIHVDLYRYTYNIDIGTITADFSIESMKNKAITVKRLVMTNCANEFDFVDAFSSTLIPTSESIYGELEEFDYEIFGGGNIGYKVGSSLAFGGSFTLNYQNVREDWSGKYDNTINNNLYNVSPGHLKTSATGLMAEATIISLEDNNDNIIGVSEDNSLKRVLTINKTLTGLAANYHDPYPLNGGRNKQDNLLKLVIEVEIDGETMFYPMHILAPQPNTIYHLENITLKGAPSPYCNFYPVTYDTTSGASVMSVSETTIHDISAGVNPDTGELVN